jgi:hypothetical protein
MGKFKVGQSVVVHSLRTATEHNGVTGTVVAVPPGGSGDDGRYGVKLPSGTTINAKRANLRAPKIGRTEHAGEADFTGPMQEAMRSFGIAHFQQESAASTAAWFGAHGTASAAGLAFREALRRHGTDVDANDADTRGDGDQRPVGPTVARRAATREVWCTGGDASLLIEQVRTLYELYSCCLLLLLTHDELPNRFHSHFSA